MIFGCRLRAPVRFKSQPNRAAPCNNRGCFAQRRDCPMPDCHRGQSAVLFRAAAWLVQQHSHPAECHISAYSREENDSRFRGQGSHRTTSQRKRSKLPTMGKSHGSLPQYIEGHALLRLPLTDFQIGNARQPLALTLPLKSMEIRHVPAGSSMIRLPQSMRKGETVAIGTLRRTPMP
jgi:hypothetical protein